MSTKQTALIASIFALGAGLVGCGYIKFGEEEQVLPGVILDCDANGTSDEPKMLCMPATDEFCHDSSRYVWRAHCALSFGGAPIDYMGNVSIVHEIATDGDTDGSPGETYTECNAWAAEEDMPPDVSPSQGLSTYTECNNCRLCRMQIHNYEKYGPESGWGELDWCPPTFKKVEDFCEDDIAIPGDSGSGSGGEFDSGIWMCIGSWNVQGVMTDWSFDPPSKKTVSMSPPGLSSCVIAEDMDDAAASCEQLCWTLDESYQKQADLNNNLVWSSLSCASLGSFIPEKPINPIQECYGGGPMGSIADVPFQVNLEFVAAEAVDQSLEIDLSGNLVIDQAECSDASCDLGISRMVLDPASFSGSYPVQGSSPIAFDLNSLAITLARPLHARLDSSNGDLEFSGRSITIEVSAASVALEGSRVGAIPRTVLRSSQLTGQMNARNEIEIDGRFNLPDGEIRMSLKSGPTDFD